MKVKFILLALILIIFLSFSVYAECGNNQCEEGENACSCPDDCGKCSGEVSNRKCAEYYCTGDGICAIQLILNCCRNEICENSGEYYEDFGNCPSDCEPKNVNLNVLTPNSGKKIRYGEDLFLKITADADGRNIAGVKIKVNEPFEKLTFFNDGLHDDNLSHDNIYATTTKIINTIKEGNYNLFFSTSFRGIDGNTSLAITVFPQIDINTIIPSELEIGNTLNIQGISSIESNPVKTDFNFLLKTKDNLLIFSENKTSNEKGEFSFLYRSTFLDEPGEWILSIYGEDEYKNTVKLKKTIKIIEPGKMPKRNITFLKSIKESYSNGEEIELLIQITEKSLPVENAKVLISAGKNSSELTNIGNGKYAGTVVFVNEDVSKTASLNIQVINENGLTIIQEKFPFKTSIGELRVEISELEKKVFGTGEKIKIKAIVINSENFLVSDANVYLLLNNKKLNLEIKTAGVYSAEYLVDKNDEGTLELLIVAENEFAIGNITKTIFISGKSDFKKIEENWKLLLFVLLVISGAGYFLIPKYKKYLTKSKKENKLIELNTLEKEAQKRYFNEKTINKKEYNNLIEKYKKEKRETEL